MFLLGFGLFDFALEFLVGLLMFSLVFGSVYFLYQNILIVLLFLPIVLSVILSFYQFFSKRKIAKKWFKWTLGGLYSLSVLSLFAIGGVTYYLHKNPIEIPREKVATLLSSKLEGEKHFKKEAIEIDYEFSNLETIFENGAVIVKGKVSGTINTKKVVNFSKAFKEVDFAVSATPEKSNGAIYLRNVKLLDSPLSKMPKVNGIVESGVQVYFNTKPIYVLKKPIEFFGSALIKEIQVNENAIRVITFLE